MHRRIILIIIISLIIISFTGCWDSLDINDKEITTTVIVDYIDTKYSFVVELANLESGGEEGGEIEKFKIVKSIGKTFVLARRNLDNKLPKPIFLGTVRIVIMTENMAKLGIEEYCYRMRNLNEYRKALHVVTISDDPIEFLKIHSDSNMSSGHNIEAILRNLEKNGRSFDISLSEILDLQSRDHTCFLLPYFKINEQKIELFGYSLIDNNIFKSIIPAEDSIGIIYILNDKVKTKYVIEFDKGLATIEAIMKKKKIIPSYKNEEISFDISFTFDSMVEYLDINDGIDENDIRVLEEELNKKLSEDVSTAITISQDELKCDFLGLSEYFRIKYPNEYKNMDWEDEYKDAKIDYSIEVELDPGGEFDYNPDVKWKDD